MRSTTLSRMLSRFAAAVLTRAWPGWPATCGRQRGLLWWNSLRRMRATGSLYVAIVWGRESQPFSHSTCTKSARSDRAAPVQPHTLQSRAKRLASAASPSPVLLYMLHSPLRRPAASTPSPLSLVASTVCRLFPLRRAGFSSRSSTPLMAPLKTFPSLRWAGSQPASHHCPPRPLQPLLLRQQRCRPCLAPPPFASPPRRSSGSSFCRRTTNCA
mmetsp:Transcript_69923/g.155840  ORF Transcript_69923/g.155840 Transcript_69923/m.155840 type:complete len:214 (+) Transcript_69923:696-1337(+)